MPTPRPIQLALCLAGLVFLAVRTCASADPLVMDAMVGQVNGRPIYASAIFNDIGIESLQRLGESQPRLVFRAEAKKLIDADLRARVQNAVILAEAERGLSEREQLGLLGYLKTERERILAQFGGILADAEAGLQREKGHGLDAELEARRQQILTDKFLRDKLYPKIHVSKRDVERYYQDHIADYHPTPMVELRVILVKDERTADQVDAALKAGTEFEEAARKYSVFRGAQGGLMEASKLDGPFEEYHGLAWPELNEKVRTLSVGQRTDRTKIDIGYGWVELEKLERGKSRTLQDAYLEIENGLRMQQFGLHSRKYMNELLEHGNYTPVDQMSNALLDVAMSRFARPQ
ncbi:MAG: hypothetical protein GC162_08025 [Planctomycetes bacterium]|nr:hypothetical protein [Planctomycetota bacterium]